MCSSDLGEEKAILGSFDQTGLGWGVFAQVERQLAYSSIQEMVGSTWKWAIAAFGMAPKSPCSPGYQGIISKGRPDDDQSVAVTRATPATPACSKRWSAVISGGEVSLTTKRGTASSLTVTARTSERLPAIRSSRRCAPSITRRANASSFRSTIGQDRDRARTLPTPGPGQFLRTHLSGSVPPATLSPTLRLALTLGTGRPPLAERQNVTRRRAKREQMACRQGLTPCLAVPRAAVRLLPGCFLGCRHTTQKDLR